MKIYDFVQGTPEWRKARAGIPTASKFSEVITQVRLELSTASDAYENRLVAERLTGRPIEDFKGTREMERGKELEGDAVQFYEMAHGIEAFHAGFITNDAGTFGASPDFLVGDIGGGELKCPGAQTHVGYLLNPEKLYQDYRLQVQGNLLASERQWWDCVSYHPELPPVFFRVERDAIVLEKLSTALETMEDRIQTKVKMIQAMRSK